MMNQLAKSLENFGVQMVFCVASALPKETNFDLIHIASLLYVPYALANVYEWALQKNIPIIFSPLFENRLNLWFHNVYRKHNIWGRLYKVLGYQMGWQIYRQWHERKLRNAADFTLQRELLRASHVVTNTEYEAKTLRDWFGLPKMPVAIVPLGIDADHFNPSTVTPSSLPCQPGYVLQTSRIQEEKNQALVIEALFNDPCDIVFVGSTVSRQSEYWEYCTELGKKRGRVYFLGHVPYADLPSIYAQAELHVLASWMERPGLVTLEAAAMGTPVVSTNQSSIGEYLPGLVSWCDPSQVASIRDAVEKTRAKKHDKQLLSDTARQFTWDKTAGEMKKVYDQVQAQILSQNTQNITNISSISDQTTPI